MRVTEFLTSLPAIGEGKRDVAGAGGKIERALAAADVRKRDQLRLPSRVLPVRQQRGDQVVAIRDRRKQVADVLTLGLWSLERGLELRHSQWSVSAIGVVPKERPTCSVEQLHP